MPGRGPSGSHASRASKASARRRRRTRTRPIEGGVVWTFDPLHRTTSPMPFRVEIFEAFVRRITARTLLMFAERGFRLPDEKTRAGWFADARTCEIPGVGHMM